MAIANEIIKLIKQVADDLERWIDKEPDKPFPDFQFLSETIFYAGNKKAAVQQLSRIDCILLSLRKHNQGWADDLVEKVEDLKAVLSSVDRLVGYGYSRRQCVHTLETPALRLAKTLRDIAKMAEQPAGTGQKSKYPPEKIKNMLATFDKHLREKKGVKYAWNCVADEHGIESAKAAEMAVRRYRKKNK